MLKKNADLAEVGFPYVCGVLEIMLKSVFLPCDAFNRAVLRSGILDSLCNFINPIQVLMVTTNMIKMMTVMIMK